MSSVQPNNVFKKQTTTFCSEDVMLSKGSQLPVGSIVFVIDSETLYVRVNNGFRPATVSDKCQCCK